MLTLYRKINENLKQNMKAVILIASILDSQLHLCKISLRLPDGSFLPVHSIK